jgi:hypothetical protein
VSTGRWVDPAVPNSGWECVNVTDLGRPAATCEMCCVQTIRYVHHMHHPGYPDELGCGCVCAGYMEDCQEAAIVREAFVRRLPRHREAFAGLDGWEPDGNGGLVFKVPVEPLLGFTIHAFPVTSGDLGWSGRVTNQRRRIDFGLGFTYTSASAAVFAAFNAIHAFPGCKPKGTKR